MITHYPPTDCHFIWIHDKKQTLHWWCNTNLLLAMSEPSIFSPRLVLIFFLCACVCVWGGVVFIYAVSVSHLNYRGRLTLCYQGSFQSNASSECVSALSHHPVCLIYGLTQMSSAERNRAFIWCHRSFLSLTCHQLASLGNIFDVRVVHVLRTPPSCH